MAYATLSDDAALLHRRLPPLPASRFCINAAAAPLYLAEAHELFDQAATAMQQLTRDH
ncbi:MAG TPA: hypothetical protein VNO31_09215 [Umezawaea sp.]|nr:hypothetical protein [Umezawaea sp.]